MSYLAIRLCNFRRACLAAALVLPAAACDTTGSMRTHDVRFELTWNGQPVRCGVEFGGGLQLTDFRLYLAAARVRSDERWVDASDRVWLLDFEDGTGACLNGTEAIVDRIQFEAAAESIDAIEFVLGVPFERNHADPLLAAPPLDRPEMHWHWRSGYKFLRAGLAEGERRWHVHLGSTGCQGPIGAVSHCERPNRARLRIDDPTTDMPISIDLARLLDGVADDVAASAHCLGDRTEAVCRQVMRNLGLDPDTGQAERSAPIVVSRR